MPRGHLMLQSARNLEAYRCACELAKRCHPRQTCVLASVPGDCEDDEAVAIARVIARGFNRIMLKDERDRRGRDRLEMPVLAAEAILQVRPLASCGIYEDEHHAVERAIETMADAEVVFLFAEDTDDARVVLTERGGEPVATASALLEIGGSAPIEASTEPHPVESAPPYDRTAYKGRSCIVYARSRSPTRGERA